MTAQSVPAPQRRLARPPSFGVMNPAFVDQLNVTQTRMVVEVLRRGGVVYLMSDCGYAICVDPRHPVGVRALDTLLDHTGDPIPVTAADESVAALVLRFTDTVRTLTGEYWADSTGRRNTSMTEVCGGEFEKAVAGASGRCAAAVGCGQGAAAGDAIAGSAGAVAGGAARVLASDRDRDHDGRSVGWGGRVMAGRHTMVSPRWRDDAAEPGRAHGPVSVVRRT